MRRNTQALKYIDWSLVFSFIALVIVGLLAIYSTTTQVDSSSISSYAFKQLIWIIVAVTIALLSSLVDFRFFISSSFLLYAAAVLSLLILLFIGYNSRGAVSWFKTDFFSFQPSELAKWATCLMLASLMSNKAIQKKPLKKFGLSFLIILLPIVLIILQGDWGSALVFSFISLAFFREGLPILLFYIGIGISLIFFGVLVFEIQWIILASIVLGIIATWLFKKNGKSVHLPILVCIVFVVSAYGVDHMVENSLPKRHQDRLKVLSNPDEDPLGSGYQVMQSKIAIGSGGFWGKGFLQGTQTEYEFIPDQHTDFIFCTIGEEFGWLGSTFVLLLFLFFCYRLLYLSERQKSDFARIYGYCITAIFFSHIFINISMTIGVFPVVGIPLPFLSYGGSSLLGFTIMLFTLLNLDSHRALILAR